MSRKNFSEGCCRAGTGGTGTRGARTPACRVHTRVNAEPGVGTRPRIVLNGPDQVRLQRIFFNVSSNPVPFFGASDPMIVGLALPKRLTCAIQEPIRLPRGEPFERFQELSRRYHGQEQGVNVVRHDYKRAQFVVAELSAAVQRIDDDFCDRLLGQVHWTTAPGVEVSIHPGEGLARSCFRGRWKSPGRHDPVQRPGYEQPAAFGIAVGQSAAGVHQPSSVRSFPKISRSHECERGTHECVRHVCV